MLQSKNGPTRAFVVCALRALAVSCAVPDRPRKPPSFWPRALAAASALRVRSPIMPASSSATLDICCNGNRPVAPSMVGMSTKRISTSAARSFDRKATGQARDVGDYESGRSGERPKLEAALQLCRAHRAALASRWMSWGFDGERMTTAIKFLGTQGVQAR
jgi:hypothetical protein